MPARCDNCDDVIERERAALLLTTCLCCAEKQQPPATIGLMSYDHKTAGSVIILPPNPESQRKAFNCYRRQR